MCVGPTNVCIGRNVVAIFAVHATAANRRQRARRRVNESIQTLLQLVGNGAWRSAAAAPV